MTPRELFNWLEVTSKLDFPTDLPHHLQVGINRIKTAIRQALPRAEKWAKDTERTEKRKAALPEMFPVEAAATPPSPVAEIFEAGGASEGAPEPIRFDTEIKDGATIRVVTDEEQLLTLHVIKVSPKSKTADLNQRVLIQQVEGEDGQISTSMEWLEQHIVRG